MISELRFGRHGAGSRLLIHVDIRKIGALGVGRGRTVEEAVAMLVGRECVSAATRPAISPVTAAALVDVATPIIEVALVVRAALLEFGGVSAVDCQVIFPAIAVWDIG